MQPCTAVNCDLVLQVAKPEESSHDAITHVSRTGHGLGAPIVRLTGGCAGATHAEMITALETVVPAFDGFRGVMVFGGTRMRYSETLAIRLGITEAAPLIAERNENVLLIGVTPKVGEILPYHPNGCTIDSGGRDVDGRLFDTIVHPYQDRCYVIQYSTDRYLAMSEADRNKIWDTECDYARRICLQEKAAGLNPVLLAYNGGGATDREIGNWLQNGLPVIVVRGSGRTSDKVADLKENAAWRERFPQLVPLVHVAENSAESLREVLFTLKVVQAGSFASTVC